MVSTTIPMSLGAYEYTASLLEPTDAAGMGLPTLSPSFDNDQPGYQT